MACGTSRWQALFQRLIPGLGILGWHSHDEEAAMPHVRVVGTAAVLATLVNRRKNSIPDSLHAFCIRTRVTNTNGMLREFTHKTNTNGMRRV